MKFKTLSAILFCSAAFAATSSFAGEQTQENFSAVERIAAGHTKEYANHKLLQAKIITCTVRSDTKEGNPVTLRALKKEVIFNHQLMAENAFVQSNLYAGDVISFEIKPLGGRIGITNDSQHILNLRCK
jgi:hypothetical protein